MEIRIGVRDVARELSLDVSEDTDAVVKAVHKALEKSASDAGAALELTSQKGRRVIVPVAALGYVEIGEEEPRKVGFGSV